MTRILVAYGSKNGSTAEIAEELGRAMRAVGSDVDVRPADEVREVASYDAVLVGSAVYMARWRPEAVGLLRRTRRDLATRPLWLFQSGPLDRSAEQKDIPLPRNVQRLAEATGARGHRTFGGSLADGTKGMIAKSLVERGKGGDFRNLEEIRRWGTALAVEIGAVSDSVPHARPA